MARKRPPNRWLRNNSLSIVLGSLFLAFLVGLALSGHQASNQELQAHGESQLSFLRYLGSGGFIEAVFENWESEFLQMGALVILTIFLYQKGSADSKSQSLRATSRHAIIHGHITNMFHGRPLKKLLYANSLGLMLFALFIASFILHAVGGTAAHNQDAAFHHEPAISVWSYVTTAQFWFESFQNWQSEFLAVVALILLSVSLRQQGSPESKNVSDPDGKTGA